MALPVLSADGSTSAITVIPGAPYVGEFGGTFGGGSLTLERLMPNGTDWSPFEDDSGTIRTFASDGGLQFVTTSKQVRATLAGATSPSITVNIQKKLDV